MDIKCFLTSFMTNLFKTTPWIPGTYMQYCGKHMGVYNTNAFLSLSLCIVTVLLLYHNFLPLSFSAQPNPCSCSQSPHHCPCPWVIHICSLTSPFPFFPWLFSSPLPSGYCQFVPRFHVSGSILLISLFYLLDPFYKWDHMIFVSYQLAYIT